MKDFDKSGIRVRYYPITPHSIDINEFDSYLGQLQSLEKFGSDPSFKKVLKNLQFENRPHVYRIEGEAVVSRPIPFENIVSIDVVSESGQSYDRIESKTFDRSSVKRYIFSNWRSWLKELEKTKLLRGGK